MEERARELVGLLAGECDSLKDVQNLLKELFKGTIEQMLESEMDEHLGYDKHSVDGIKRDRWVWSGDAYQSYLIDYYLFFDLDIIKRTMLALRGKDPVESHLNTIMDYSFYWVIALGDYLRYTGDAAFIRAAWPRLKTLLQFCLDRRDGDGFMVGQPNDRVFIDWAEIDKTGAVCAEQMLLCRALEVAADCARLLDEDDGGYRQTAISLRLAIEDKFWDEEKRAYIDSFASGQRKVTRHANLFAILLGFADEARTKIITESVINNDSVPQIRTPYFKFYELEALCATRQRDRALDAMRAYWGGMLDLGVTTIWEEFDPRMSGDEHYAMYGERYHKSLCHAWGASPIYLLGCYYLGVRPTSDGYAIYEARRIQRALNGCRARCPSRVAALACHSGMVCCACSPTARAAR